MSLNANNKTVNAIVEINIPFVALTQFSQLKIKNNTRFGKIHRLIRSGSNLPINMSV